MSETRGEVFLRIAEASPHVEDVREMYRGRGFYEGPAATVPQPRVGEFLAEMPLPCKWDSMGKSSLIIYPDSPDLSAKSALRDAWRMMEPEFDSVRFA